jgi:hypothetical protein
MFRRVGGAFDCSEAFSSARLGALTQTLAPLDVAIRDFAKRANETRGFTARDDVPDDP